MSCKKKSLAIFDFDNTITTKDTLIDFLRFYAGDFNLILGLLKCSPIILLYKLRVIPNKKAKEHLLEHFLKNVTEEELIKAGKQYSANRLSKILNPDALSRIDFHIQKKDVLVVISASPQYWYRDWCMEKGFIQIISTRLEIHNGKITGKIRDENCFGDEKLRRLKNEIQLEGYDYIYAYGDSNGDLELLNFGNESYFKFKRFK